MCANLKVLEYRIFEAVCCTAAVPLCILHAHVHCTMHSLGHPTPPITHYTDHALITNYTDHALMIF